MMINLQTSLELQVQGLSKLHVWVRPTNSLNYTNVVCSHLTDKHPEQLLIPTH